MIPSRGLGIETADRFWRARNAHPEWMTWIELSAEDLTQIILGRIFRHLYLFDYYPLFGLQLGFIEQWVGDHVSDQIERFGQLLVDHLCNKPRLLVCSECFKAAAETVHFDRDIERRTPVCTFEYSMFDEM